MGSGVSSTGKLEITQPDASKSTNNNTEKSTKNLHHHTQSSSWVPPKESWENINDNGLPYANEHALDDDCGTYYLNHEKETTQREDPTTQEAEEDPPPEPRTIKLTRDPKMGFGFVAGSEKPVIVRFVTEGGPSEDRLLPGDCIIQINEENVEKVPRERVIELVRNSAESITITVCQPHSDNSGRKSALLTAAKKARLRNNPSRVRFADAVIVNGTAVISPSTHESYIPFMPNVLKVFLENGQTKSFKYDNQTIVSEVLDSLQEKLNVKCLEHFSLVLQNMKSPSHGKMTFLQDTENLAEIAARPGSQHFKCLFRLTFVPRDSYDLVRRDPNAFEYFYIQCTNDVIQERYASELKYDVALRLASLHINQHCISNNMSKVSLKLIEKETGLDKFLPESLLESMKIKDIRKMLNHYTKVNHNLALPGQKHLTDLQTKMHYLKILSEVRSFGGKCFLVTLVEKKAEVMISVGPKQGISLVTNIKNNILAPLADFDQIECMSIEKDERETVRRVVLHMKGGELKTMSFVMLQEEVTDFVCLVEGYYRVCVNKEANLLLDKEISSPDMAEVPPYRGTHHVSPASWSYPIDVENDTNDKTKKTNNTTNRASTNISPKNENNARFNNTQITDFSHGTPPYHKSKEYFDNVKKNLTLEVKQQEGIKQQNKPNAPLASPDLSTLSNSSESSVQASVDTTPTPGYNNNQTEQLSASEIISFNPVDSNLVLSDIRQVHIKQSTNGDADTSFKTTGNRNILSSDDDYGDEGDSSTLRESRNIETITNSNNTVILEQLRKHISNVKLKNSKLNVVHGDDRRTVAIKTESEESICKRAPHSEVKTSHLQYDDINKNNEHEDDSNQETLLNEIAQISSESLTDVILRKRNGESGSIVIQSTEMIAPGDVPPHTVVLRPKSDTKRRVKQRFTRERPGSFGLHSPDKVPETEEELQELTKQYQQLSGNKTVQGIERSSSSASDVRGSYNPKLFCDGGLYLDPDIIDLTFLEPENNQTSADTEGPLMDFTSPKMASPPPEFNDDRQLRASPDKLHDTSTESGGSIPLELADLPGDVKEKLDAMIADDLELGTQISDFDAMILDEEAEKESGIDSESDSGTEVNEYSAKTPTCPSEVIRRKKKSRLNTREVFSQLAKRQSYQHVDFGADDIDVFIASVTVPPPPKDDPEGFAIPKLSEPPKPKLSLSSQPVLSKGAIKKKLAFSEDGIMINKSGFDNRVTVNYGAVGGQDDGDDELAKWFAKRNMNVASFDEDISKLILPPPSSNSSEITLDDLPIVPPVLEQKRTENSNAYIYDNESNSDKYFITGDENVNSDLRFNGKNSPKSMSRKMPSKKLIEIKENDGKAGKFPQRSISLDERSDYTQSEVDKNSEFVSIKQNVVRQISAAMQERVYKEDSSPTKSPLTSRKSGTTRRVSYDNKSKSSSSPTRSNSSGSPNSPRRSRPLVPPPPPPANDKSTRSALKVGENNNVNKFSRPAPPKRFSSLENGDSTLSLHNELSDSAKNEAQNVDSKVVLILDRKKAISTSNLSNSSGYSATLKEFNANYSSGIINPSDRKSMENSPVHVPIRVVHSLGTLPRTRKKNPPPPPPRRTSSTSSNGGQYNEMHELLSRSVENVSDDKPKFSTFGPSSGRDITGRNDHSTSESSIFTMFKNSPLSAVNGNSQNLTGNAEIVAVNTQGSPRMSLKNMGANKMSNKSSPKLKKKQHGSSLNRKARNSDSNSSDSLPGSPVLRGRNYVSPSIQAKQNAIASALYNRQNSQDDEDVDKISPSSTNESIHSHLASISSSPSVSRSNTFSNSTVPRPYTSPRSSPALHRHSSFSKAADRSPAPFKTFLGENSGALHNSVNSGKVSGTASKIEYGAHIQTKENGVKSVPMKVVRPMVSTSSTLPRQSSSGNGGSPRSPIVNHHNNAYSATLPRQYSTGSGNPVQSTTFRHQNDNRSHNPLGQQHSREGSNSGSSRDTTPVQSPRHSASGSPVSNSITSQRRFFPARKSPAPPVPASTPELPVHSTVTIPATTSSSNTSSHSKNTRVAVVNSNTSGVAPKKAHQSENFSDSLRHAVQQRAASISYTVNGEVNNAESIRTRASSGSPAKQRTSVNITSNHVSRNTSSTKQSSMPSVNKTMYNNRTASTMPLQQTQHVKPNRTNNVSGGGNKSGIDASQYTINQIHTRNTSSEDCDIPDEIISKQYEGPRSFEHANLDVDSLVQYLDRSISNLALNLCDKNGADFRTNKDFLVAESRQFVTDSKMLVSSATQNEDSVVQNVNSSIKTLARIVYHCSNTMNSLASMELAGDLGRKVKDVAISYKTTVTAARVAAGKPLSDPQMKSLMRQATGLAAILSTLMKALKNLGISNTSR